MPGSVGDSQPRCAPVENVVGVLVYECERAPGPGSVVSKLCPTPGFESAGTPGSWRHAGQLSPCTGGPRTCRLKQLSVVAGARATWVWLLGLRASAGSHLCSWPRVAPGGPRWSRFKPPCPTRTAGLRPPHHQASMAMGTNETSAERINRRRSEVCRLPSSAAAPMTAGTRNTMY